MRVQFWLLIFVFALSATAASLPANAAVEWSGAGYYLEDADADFMLWDNAIAGPFANEADCKAALENYVATLSQKDREDLDPDCVYESNAYGL